MHSIVADVRIQFRGIESPQTRLSLSAGTKEAISTPSDPFLPDAKIPRSPWRSATNQEWSLLIDESNTWEYGRSVALLRLSEYILEPLHKLELDHKSSIEEYYSIYKNPHYKPVMEEILVRLSSRYSKRTDRNRVIVMALAFPDLITVSTDALNVDEPNGERGFLGLHVDSAEKLTVTEAYKAKNRLCINVGKSDRHVLFINQTMLSIFNCVHPGREAEAAQVPSNRGIAHEFMEKNPNYPIVKLRIKPGEAYIAPTDNIVHDGCSLEATDPDVALHFLGDFHPSGAAKHSDAILKTM